MTHDSSIGHASGVAALKTNLPSWS